jgi:predicted ATP-dependent serine protease
LKGKIKKEKSLLKYKRCPECLQVVRKGLKRCQNCGHAWTTSQRELPKQVEGDLVKIEKTKKRKKYINTIKEVSKAKNIKEAYIIAEKHGYKPQYGYFIWKKILKRA